MALREQMLTDTGIRTVDKVEIAIQRLKAFEPPEGYWLAFSGGKDSVALKGVADLAGVKYEAHYSLTTVDPPELVRFIKTVPGVIIDKPKLSMWRLIEKHRMPPTQKYRYCCEYLKESSGVGRVTLTGIRWAESVRRKKKRNLVNIGSPKHRVVFNDENDESRRTVENCYRTRKTLVNPIIDWLDEDVWEFIRENKLPYCCLYDEGFKRLGCIGCPLGGANSMNRAFTRWPKYREAYVRAFDKAIAERKRRGLSTDGDWADGESMMRWWLGESDKDDSMDGQLDFEDEL